MISYCNCGMHVRSDRLYGFLSMEAREARKIQGKTPKPDWLNYTQKGANGAGTQTYQHYGSGCNRKIALTPDTPTGR